MNVPVVAGHTRAAFAALNVATNVEAHAAAVAGVKAAGTSAAGPDRFRAASGVEDRIQVARVERRAWTKSSEREFSSLAAKVALGEATVAEATKLRRMQINRRRTRNPRTMEDVLQTYRRHKIEDEVMTALRKYVRFLKSSDQT
jgi:hypothetical protein